MKPSEIHVGRTYIGKDDQGIRRTVTGKAKRGRKWWVTVKEEPFRWGTRLHKFAEWAKKEVPTQ